MGVNNDNAEPVKAPMMKKSVMLTRLQKAQARAARKGARGSIFKPSWESGSEKNQMHSQLRSANISKQKRFSSFKSQMDHLPLSLAKVEDED